MVVFIYIAIFIITTHIFRRKFGRFVNFAFIFNAIWCFFGVLSTFGLYNLRIPKLQVHLYAYLFVLIVDLCVLLFARNSKLIIPLEQNIEERTNIRKITVVSILQTVSLIMIFSLFYRSLISFITTGNLSSIRGVYFGKSFDSFYVDFFLRTVPVAMMEGLIIYYVYQAFFSKNIKYIQYASINCVIVTICSGGRYTLMLLLFTIIVCMISFKIDRQDLYSWKKYIWKIIPFLFLVIISFALVTIFRSQLFTRNIVLYYSGSLSFLDYILEHANMFALDEKLYGYLTFSAFIEPIVLVLKALGLTSIEVPDYYFDTYCQQYYNVASSGALYMNNNTSVIYYFLRDYGTVGIFIGGLLLSYLIIKSYNSWTKTQNLFYGLLFIYFCNVLFNSLMTYQFFGRSPLILILTLYLCGKQKKTVFTLGAHRFKV